MASCADVDTSRCLSRVSGRSAGSRVMMVGTTSGSGTGSGAGVVSGLLVVPCMLRHRVCIAPGVRLLLNMSRYADTASSSVGAVRTMLSSSGSHALMRGFFSVVFMGAGVVVSCIGCFRGLPRLLGEGRSCVGRIGS